MTRFASLFALSALAVGAQTFDVASIKPAAPPDASGRMRIMMGGGPGTDDPGRITYSGVPLKMILTQAFNVKAFQITGPDWLDRERFDITAKVPRGTTKEQARVMMQNLLADRFKLTIHHETKEMAAFVLSVGKNGSKLKTSDPEPPSEPGTPETPPPAPGPMGKLPMGKDGFPEFPKTPGRPAHNMMRMNGQAKIACDQCSMAEFLDMLGMQVEKPVVDMTGLKGSYDFSLIFQPELGGGMDRGPKPAGPGGPPPDSLEESQPALTTAVQEQLGLKLDSKRAPVDLIVIDHVEKTPSEN